jgi:thiol-disulfide isomerase/thioredoxin
MTKSLAAIALGLITLVGCKEKAPLINFGAPLSTDTSYVITPVPAADPHSVLIEEFTGQSCPNCPAAHETIKGLEAANPGRVNVIAMYKYSFPQTIPPHGYKYDLRDSAATNVADKVYSSVGFMPSAGVDRIPSGGGILLTSSLWAGVFSSALAGDYGVNLKVSSSWDSSSQQATIVALITYTKAVSIPQNLSIAIVEDGMVDKQEYPAGDPNFPSGVNEAYKFTNVLRGVVTASPWGDPILQNMTTKEAGRVSQMVYTYKLKTKSPAIVPAKCRIVAFVSNVNGSDIKVVQSTQAKMVP